MTIPVFGSLSPADYRALGLKAGLEVHQQLFTQKKLFCRCPAGHYSEAYDAEILRHMRPTLSELGEYDGTALMEFKTKKEIIYRLNRDTVCTYEMDDAPPFGLNSEALEQAIEIALLLQCNVVGEIHITRKQYLDGSIPTGFQRTTIVGTDGYIEVGDKRVGVRQLALEEDACREVSDVQHRRVYLTDRLSMPLIEVVTEPSLFTPEEVAEAAQVIRTLNRLSQRVRRGHGAARQDVNVSIRGGTRIEIKGVPRIPLIPRLVHFEALRQQALLQLRDALLERGLSPERFHAPHRDVTRSASKTSFEPLHAAIEAGARVRAIVLPGFGDSLTWLTQPGRPFSAEVADRVRVIACLDGQPNLVYRHFLAPNLEPSSWKRIARAARASDGDGLVLVWGPEKDTITAASEVEARCREALIGVPSETRQMLGDGLAGVTGFERILPGPDRMYPDTDLPPIAIEDERVHSARARVSPPPWVLQRHYCALGLSSELSKRMVISARRKLFEALLEESSDNPVQLARLLLDRVAPIERNKPSIALNLEDETLAELLRAVRDGRVLDEVFDELLLALADTPQVKIDQLLSERGYTPCEPEEVDRLISATCDQQSGKGPKSPEPRWRFIMGLLMSTLRGRAPGSLVAQVLSDKTKLTSP